MTKKNKTTLGIFTEAVGLYFSNFDKFIKYMTFPVLGQVGALILIFLLTTFYSKYMPIVIQKYPALSDFKILVVTAIVMILPGLVIFLKAFWEYLVAYGAINSMLENMVKSGKVYDFDAHTELIKRRTPSFIALWVLIGVFSLISTIPFFWVVSAVFAVFFVLIFQVFTYEPELNPIECAKKSLLLVKGHFFTTFVLIMLVGALTYVLIPQIFNIIFEYLNITKVLVKTISSTVELLPISQWNNFLSYIYLQPLNAEKISVFVITSFVAQIFIQYTLPLRSILWGLWYKKLNGKINSINKSSTKKSSKKPSEKLMKESHKKFTAKKLDKNILKRAMEKPDEE